MRKPSTPIIITLAVVGALLVLCGAGVGGTIYAYKDTYYPGVSVAGINLSGKTKTEGQKLLADRANQYMAHSFKVTVPDISKPFQDSPTSYEDAQISTTAKDLGLTVLPQQALDDAWKIGHTYTLSGWFPQVFSSFVDGNRHALPYSVSGETIKNFIATEVIPKIGTPTPAKVTVADTNIVIETPKPGLELSQDALKNLLVKNMENAGDSDITYVKAPVAIKESIITRESVQPLADTWDKIGDIKITLTATNPAVSITPTRKEVLGWFAPLQDDKGTLSLGIQEDVVAKYLADKKELDATKSLKAVVTKITPLVSGTTQPKTLAIAVTPKPAKVVTGDDFTLGKFEGKYVEISLAKQRLYRIDGNNLEKTYVVSTGKWSTPTPLGIFHIQGKSKRAYSASFGLYMPYWQNFLNGEYGLHELPEWPNGYKEGVDHLGTPVSHGCVRLGPGDAEELYNWTETGTPVYIH